MINVRRALISCWDKTGLDDFCRQLKQLDIEIISSGGTAEYLKKHSIAVTPVEDLTGSPEVLGGRVKTLHPVIHAGILATSHERHRQELQKIGAKPIQLVVVNLYPFVEKAVAENLPVDAAVEYIDIGGPTMLRAAAKNHQHVIAIHDPSHYEEIIRLLTANQGNIPIEYSRERARETFFYTGWYDGQIQEYLSRKSSGEKSMPVHKSLFLTKREDLRYGENPHQAAAFYQPAAQVPQGLSAMEQLWGKQLSFNNYLDVNAAYQLALEFSAPAVAIIKHTNPCGAAISTNHLTEAFRKARQGDPISAFGGIVALNRTVDVQTAGAISETFFECVIAPDFDNDALQILRKKKNLRLLKLSPDKCRNYHQEIKSVNGAYIIQETDHIEEDAHNWRVVTQRQPEQGMLEDLKFLWKISKHVKSNAIVIGKHQEVFGVGAGQMSRVDSVEIAISKARQAERDLQGAVLASDAFFPFRDGVDRAAEAGVTAIVQPGGSVRDEEVIHAANEHEMVMLFTGTRHFRH